MSDISYEEAEEKYLLSAIERLQREYQKAIEPYANRLASIRRMNPSPSLYIRWDELSECDKERVRNHLQAASMEISDGHD